MDATSECACHVTLNKTCCLTKSLSYRFYIQEFSQRFAGLQTLGAQLFTASDLPLTKVIYNTLNTAATEVSKSSGSDVHSGNFCVQGLSQSDSYQSTTGASTRSTLAS